MGKKVKMRNNSGDLRTIWVFALITIMFSGIVLAIQAFPAGPTDLRTKTCTSEIDGTVLDNFNGVCQGNYSNPVCAANGDRIGCADGINESFTTSANSRYAGINISTFNSSVSNCQSINEVFLCYGRSVVGTSTIANCNISVDSSGGSSFSQVNATCPAMNTLQPLICNNVTALESWSCANFFGTSGTRSIAKMIIKQNTGSGVRTLNIDSFFFNVTYTADTIAPLINFVSPTENAGSYVNRNYALVNVTATDINFKNISINLYNSTNGLVNSTNSTSSPLYINFTGLTNGIYYVNTTSCDTLNQCNSTETRNFTVDLINPNINFTSPTDNSGLYTTRNWIIANITASDTNLKNLSIYLYNSTNALVNSTNSTSSPLYINFTGLTNGIYYFNATTYDLAGNVNSTETRNVSIDSTNPGVNFTSPTENSGSYISKNSALVNVTATDVNFKNISIYLYNSTNALVNSTNSTSSPLYINFTGLTNGIYYVNATTYDLAGNVNSTETRNFTVDLINPNINFTSPTLENGSVTTVKSFVVNLTSNDTNYANMTLYLYNSTFNAINTTFSTTNSIVINYTNLSHGWYYFNATTYDLAGNFNNTANRAIFVNRTAILGAITAIPSNIGASQTILINTSGVAHSNNDSLQLFCNNESQSPTSLNNICTGGTSPSSYPYALTCSFVVPSSQGSYNVFCRVFDGDVYSSTKNTSYSVSTNVPVTSVVSVAGDSTPSYIDNSNDGRTDIIVQGDINITCKWASADLAYSSMTNVCSNPSGNLSRANCSITDVVSQGFITRYVACADNVTGTNGQNASQNLDVSFFLDYTAPTTSDNSVSSIQAPNYVVTITESDNVDPDPSSYYCTSSTAGCDPVTPINNGGQVTYTSSNRGVNYLRYYSVDSAGNIQTTVNRTITINQIPIFTNASDNAATIKGGTTVNVSSVSYDSDSGQTLTLFVCSSLGSTSSGCTGAQYCNSSGTSNVSCTFASQIDSATHTWYAYIYDSLNEGASNNPLTGSYLTDSTPPSITVVTPTNASYTSQNITFEIITDSTAKNSWFNLDSNSTANLTMTNLSSTQWVYAFSGLSLGSHNITFYSNDSLGNGENSSLIYFTIANPADLTAPVITILFPGNATFQTGSVLINISTDESLNWAGYQLNGGSFVDLTQASATNWYGYASSLTSETTYNLTLYANDTSNNQANKTYLLYADSSAPRFSSAQAYPSSVNISNSVNCSIYWNDGFNISSVIISEDSLGSYENHTLSFSGTSGGASYLISSVKLANPGTYHCSFYATDQAGNTNSTSLSFSVIDNIIPEITVMSPNNASYASLQTFMFIISTQENVQSAWFSLNGTANITMGNTTGKNWNYSAVLGEGSYDIIFYANRSTGNAANSSHVYFTVAPLVTDTTAPVIISNSLVNGTYYSSLSKDLNITSNENLSWAAYKLNSGSLTAMSNSSVIDWGASLTLTEGLANSLTIYLNDTSSNQRQVNLTLFADSVIPEFINATASPNPANETQSVSCSVYLNDSFGFSSVKIGEDVLVPGIFTNHTIDLSTPGWANYTILNVPKGSYQCKFYATDLAGNYDYTSYAFEVFDVTPPVLSISSPFNQTYYASTVFFSLLTNENASSAYYSLDGNSNVSLSGSTTFWSGSVSLSNGNHNVIFYSNDTSGNLANTSIVYFSVDTTIYDTTKPVVSIWSPVNGTYYTSTSILINITSDKSLSWAGYKLNSGSLTNLDNYSLRNWNISLTLTEGRYNISLYANDTGSNKNQGNKTIEFFVDTNYPIIDSFSCPNKNDSQDVVCNASLSDTIGLDYAILSYNASGTWENSSQIALSGNTSASISYTIGAGNTTPPEFSSILYLYDKSGRTNTSSVNVNVTDDTSPKIYNISYSPSSSDLLDPGVNVIINATIFEDYSYGTVSVLYKLSTDSSWGSTEMTNRTAKSVRGYTEYNASITLTNGTWYFKINASDAAGNENISANYTLVVADDLSQNINSTIPTVKSISSAQRSSLNHLGNISMNNTGDGSLNFTISTSSSSIGSRLNINGTGNQTMTYSASTGEIIELQIFVNSTGLDSDLYEYGVSISSAAGNVSYSYWLDIQSTPAPYLYTTIGTYSSSVNKGQIGVNLSASVQNFGTREATNGTLTWTIPPEFNLTSGNLTLYIGPIEIGRSYTNSIIVSVSSDSDDKYVNVTANASASNADPSGDYREISIGSPITITQIVTNNNGGGGSGGLSLSAGGGGGAIIYSKVIEMIRGQTDRFNIEVFNKDYNRSLERVTMNLTGFLDKYFEIVPNIIKVIGPRQSANFTVILKVPEYKDYEEHTLRAFIEGIKVNSALFNESYSEIQNIKLVIQEISRQNATLSLDEALSAIEEMKKSGFNIDEVSRILEQAKMKLNESANKQSWDLTQQIIFIRNKAFEVSDLIDRITQALDDPALTGLITGNVVSEIVDENNNSVSVNSIITGNVVFGSKSAEEVLALAKAAFERGDYDTALQRAKSAQVLLLLERKGNFGLFLYLYWHYLLLVMIILSVLGMVASRQYKKFSLSRRITEFDKGEENIRLLILDSQKKYFSGKISSQEYHNIMAKYHDDIAKIRKDRISLRNTRLKTFSPEQISQDVKNEREQTEHEIKKLQTQYYIGKKISEKEYEPQSQMLNERLAEIEDEETTSVLVNKADESKAKKEGGIIKVIKWPASAIRRVFEKRREKQEKFIRDKIRGMGVK